MQVKDFIQRFGIEKLNGRKIKQNNKTYRVNLSKDELEYHSITNEDWSESKGRLNRYHSKGNYRFSAIDENKMCIWVYPTTQLEVIVNELTNIALLL